MRNLVIILLCVTFFLSCTKEKEPKDYVIVAGKITNYKNIPFTLVTLKSKVIIKVKEDGTFIDTLKMVTPSKDYVELLNLSSYKHLDFQAKNGDSIYITFDDENFYKSLKFSGDNTNLNNILVQKQLVGINHKVDGHISNISSHYKNGENEFFAIEQQVLNESKSLITNSSLSTEEKNRLISDIEIENYLKLTSFQGVRVNLTGEKEFKVSSAFIDKIPNISNKYNSNDIERYKKSRSYRKLEDAKMRKKLSKYFKEFNDYELAKLKLLKEMDNSFIKDQVFYNVFKKGLRPTKYVHEFYDYAQQNLQDISYKEELKTKYESIKHLFKGSNVPVFNYENPEGTKISLTQFKGKYVYIDMWATWCGPCKDEIPSLKELEKDYHNKDIEFVSISLDRKVSKELWKKMVNEMNLGGVQLFADKSFNSEFSKYFNINAIPRFILLDKEGKIYLADAPRPSSTDIRKIFNKIV